MNTTIELTKEEKKLQKAEAKRQAEKQAKIEAERNQKPVKTLTMSIEWKKSRTWGSNPTLTAQVEFTDGTFGHGEYKCSGCGYDKESTVISQAFNAFLKYKIYQLSEDEKKLPYGIYNRPDWKAYGDGIGTNCYYKIAETIGGKFESVASGKWFDVFKFTNSVHP